MKAKILYLYTYLSEFTLEFIQCRRLLEELKKYHDVTLRYGIIPSQDNLLNYPEQTQKQFITESLFESSKYDILIIENELKIISQDESEKIRSEVILNFRNNGGIVIFLCDEDGQPFISRYNSFLRKARLPILRQPSSQSEFPDIHYVSDDYNNHFIRGYDKEHGINNKDHYFYIEINENYLKSIYEQIRSIFQGVNKIIVNFPIQTADMFGYQYLLKGNPTTRLLTSDDLWWDGDMYPTFGHFNDFFNGVGVLITGNICLDSIVENQQTDAIVFMLNLVNLFWKKQQQRSQIFCSLPESQDKYIEEQQEPRTEVEELTQAEFRAFQHNNKLYMNNADNQIRILHLSDIHLGTTAQAQRYFTQLATDLTQNLNVKQLNYLVISGDIANRSTQEEYDAAFELVDKLVKRYGLDPSRIVIVPGNHDLNWELSETAYTFVPKRRLPNPLPEGRYIDAGNAGALICNEDEYQKRFGYFSDYFYKKIYNNPYPQEYDQQAIIYPCSEDKILFLGLNSCWEIDHEYKDRAGIHPDAIANALDQILTGNYNDWLKIAVWHHPVNSSESMKNVAFLEQLAVNDFQLGIHGHIHEAKDENFQYDTRRGLKIIAAGTFGAPAREQVTGIPHQYNLLTLDPEIGVMTVETRKKEKADGAWSADARWGDKNNPVPRYKINLRYGKGSKTYNSSTQPKNSPPNNSANPQQRIFDNVQAGSNITVGNTTQNDYSGITSPSSKRTILILASSSTNTARLRLDQEVREIDEGLRRSQQREQFILQQRWAIRPDDLRRALLDFNPQIVHFSGHESGKQGLVLENDVGEAQLVPTNALSSLFKLFANQGVECVVLNACYAEVQAQAISQHINYVIGMSDEISDDAAISFAVGFYDALGAGRSYEDAYEFGCNAIALQAIPEELIPVLKKKTN